MTTKMFLTSKPQSVLSTIHEAWRVRRAWWFTATSRTRARFARTFLGSFWLGLSNLLSIAALAIVYGTVVSLGFATLENYDYVYRLAEYYNLQPIEIAYARSYSAIPLHALCGVIMGFYFGMYAFVSGGKNLSLALIVPYVIHGSYNFLVSFPNYYYLGVLLIALLFSIFLYKNVRDSQKLKKSEHEKKVI